MIDSRLIHLIICPYCHTKLSEDDNELICSNCNRIYPIIRGIPDFRHKDDYWCNVSRDKMQHLNHRARETGDWLNSAKEIIPQYTDHVIPFHRADSQFLWPTTKDSRILDAGSMWGGLTIPAAQFHREVYAVDKTVETLEFLKIRAEQMGFENIYTFAAPINSLPFLDDFFDLVVLNGVLEWVGLEENTILEKHWKGRRTDRQIYYKSPEEMQLDVLEEIRRVLKPNGSLFIAIENRWGIQYFLSYPDDHNNVRFVTFLPRFLANMISKIMGKGEYRTYIYSPRQLANLLQKGGFNISSVYGVFPHYMRVKKAFPLKIAGLFKNEIQIDGIVPKVFHALVKHLIPRSIVKQTIPSLFAICAEYGRNELIPRIENMLIEANIIRRKGRVRFVISNNRYENYNSTNVIIYDYNDRPLYFCKIARDPKISGLQTEAENLKWISNKISTSKGINFRIPELIYFGVVDNVKVFVTTFLDAENVELIPYHIMNNGFDRIGITNGFIRKNIGFGEETYFLKRIDRKVRRAISSLVEFQQITSNGKSNISDIVTGIVNKYSKKCQGNLPDEIRHTVSELEDRIRRLPEISVLTCSVHGDHDFDNVLFFSDGTTGLVDFEHLEKKGSPFFDLATLIFNPLIMKWKNSYLKNESFAKYLDQYGAIEYITNWLKYFCDKQHMPYSIISTIPLLAAIDQNIKIYPSFRDPHTYPMYGESMLKELSEIKIGQEYLKYE